MDIHLHHPLSRSHWTACPRPSGSIDRLRPRTSSRGPNQAPKRHRIRLPCKKKRLLGQHACEAPQSPPNLQAFAKSCPPQDEAIVLATLACVIAHLAVRVASPLAASGPVRIPTDGVKGGPSRMCGSPRSRFGLLIVPPLPASTREPPHDSDPRSRSLRPLLGPRVSTTLPPVLAILRCPLAPRSLLVALLWEVILITLPTHRF